MKKRIISLLMALLMLTSLLPSAVWAEGDTPEQTAAAVTDDGAAEQEPAATPETPETPEAPEAPVEPEQPAEPEQSTEPKAAAEPEADAEPDSNGIALYSTASGQCGNNLTWTLDGGVLTISGKGAMWSWDQGSDWGGFSEETGHNEITTVVINSGVTSIGRGAFGWLSALTSVSIPASVKTIGLDAFAYSDNLTDITYAGAKSTWQSGPGKTITLPLKTVVHCSNGNNILPPTSGKCGTKVTYTISDDGVLTISGTGAMANYTYKDNDSSNCPWHSVRWAIKKVVIEDGVTSIGDFAFAFDISLADVTIPGSVTSIGNRAFMGTPLTSVVIPEGVKTIGQWVFWCCTSLKSITLPTSLAKVGQGAFYAAEDYDGEFYSELTDIYYGGDPVWFWNNIQGIGDSRIHNGVTVHYNGATGDAIDGGQCGANAFWTLDKNGTLTVSGAGAMYDYDYDDSTSPWLIWDVSKIKKIDVREGITAIGAYAFCQLSSAAEVSLPSTLTAIGQDAFWGIGAASLVIPDSVKRIDNFAFNTCVNLKTITLPAGLQKIGHCFIECEALKTIYFGGSMADWLACGGGQSIFPTTTNVVCQGVGTLAQGGPCGDNLTRELDNNGNLIILGTGDMYDFTYDETGSCTSPWADCRSMIRSIAISSNVTSIGAWAFEDTNITSLTIPGNVKTIGDGSFSCNRYLSTLTLESGLETIGAYAFADCRIVSVVIPDGVTSIGENAFASCVRADYINGEWVDTGLTTVTIPGSVTSIGKNAFADNSLLTTVNYGGTQEQWNAIGGKNAGIPSSATFNCVKVVANGTCGTGVKWSLASNGVLTITGTGKGVMTDYNPGRAPWANKTVTQVIVGEGVTHVGSYAFAEMGITRVSLPESLTSIGHHAFSFSAITAVTIPGSVTTIDPEAFWGCSDLTSLTICDGVTAIDSAVFGECTALTKLVLPDSVTTIGQEAFHGCTALEEIIFSQKLTFIGYMAFKNCTGLTELVFPDSLKEIGQEAFFRDACMLNSISLGAGLTTIGSMAFGGCCPTTVDYRGTQKEWSSITIGNGNDCLSRATFIKLGVIVTDGDTPDVTDVASLYDQLTGQAESEYTPQQELSADVNRDGTLDVYDLQLLYEAVTQGVKL